MKKLLLLTALVFCLACKKEEKTYCWQCEDYSFISSRVISTDLWCHETEESIAKLQRDLSMPGLYSYTCTRY
jgi:hypothetical protein